MPLCDGVCDPFRRESLQWAVAPAPAKPHNWRRLDGVDLLRGLAILLVLLNHVNIRLRGAHVPFSAGLPAQLTSSLFWNGQRGVQIFFAISGFLITSTSLRRWGALSKVSPLDFYRLRFARIAPLLFLLLTILTALHFAHVKYFVVSPKTGGIGSALRAALTFRVNVLEANHGYLPANWDILWSLGVEEVFYLFFPLACRFLARRKILYVLLVCFVIAGPFARAVWSHGNEVWREYSYLGSMDAIALGCLTAITLSSARITGRTSRFLAIAGSVLLAVCLGCTLLLDRLGVERLGLDMTFVAIATCMIIAASAATEWRGPRVLGPALLL
ncbi:MAG TPA: acyltransferase, partial [Bryobacteraceae bacterium]|nr:acyltransferase [Bryobacteraceae bacterium]